MKLSGRALARLLTGPLGIVPIALLVAFGTDVLIESSFNMILPPGRVSFLRGSDDYGCSNLFAAATALYVAFGFLASWHLTLRLSEAAPAANALRDLLRALGILKFHLAAFVVGGWMFSEGGGCDRLHGSDFRNTFLLASVVFALTMGTTVWLYRWRRPEAVRLLLGPAAVLVWVFLGADGMTPKTWAQPSATQVTVNTVSRRHALMWEWYQFCERTFGESTGRAR
jgi:hypothetical protein